MKPWCTTYTQFIKISFLSPQTVLGAQDLRTDQFRKTEQPRHALVGEVFRSPILLGLTSARCGAPRVLHP